MDTSEWKFLSDDPVNLPVDGQQYFDPWRSEMPATQRKEKCMEEIDQTLEKETREAMMEEMRREVAENRIKSSSSHKSGAEISEAGPKTSSTSRKENSELLTNLKEYRVDTNPYLVLLNRLDEEEGVRTPSIEDKLKLAEDRLRVSINGFCEACDELISEKKTDSEPEKEEKLLEPEVVREAFRPKVFEPSLRPPQTLSVSELSKKPMVGTGAETKKAKPTRRDKKMKEVLKQGFYLPSDTWFTQEKEAETLTPEEIELLNSTSTKAFLKFLDDRKKEPPKILKEIQKKLQDTQQLGK